MFFFSMFSRWTIFACYMMHTWSTIPIQSQSPKIILYAIIVGCMYKLNEILLLILNARNLPWRYIIDDCKVILKVFVNNEYNLMVSLLVLVCFLNLKINNFYKNIRCFDGNLMTNVNSTILSSGNLSFIQKFRNSIITK